MSAGSVSTGVAITAIAASSHASRSEPATVSTAPAASA